MIVHVLTTPKQEPPPGRGQRALFEALTTSWTSQRAEVLAVVDPSWPVQELAAALRMRSARDQQALLPGPELVTFSSGTTGRPRGICRSLASWDRSLAPFEGVTGLAQLDPGPWWIPGPLWSSMSLFAGYHAVRAGRPVILGSEDAGEAVAVHCVPAALPGVLAQVRAGRLPRLRTAVVAGDRLPSAWWQAATAAGVRVVEYYGAAELSFCAVRDAAGGQLRAFPGVQVQVRDGVLWSCSPYQADGYLDPDRPGPLRRDEAGWATVGDCARWVGSSGGFEVLGRGDDAVTVGGATVSTGDVEDVLRTLPGVHDAAVVGVPHRLLGQQVGALVVTDRDLARLRQDARDRLAGPALPRRWVTTQALPRTSSGKIDRPAVRVALRAQ